MRHELVHHARSFGYLQRMTLADEYFSERELNSRLKIDSVSKLWELLHGKRLMEAVDPESRLGKMANARTFYRGQADAGYSLSSNLYRLCRETHPVVTESLLSEREDGIIAAMRQEGIGRRMTDGELLMVLQHHGIPTRLVDVSTEPMEAAFFSVDKHDERDGRLFMVTLESQPKFQLKNRGLPWSGSNYGSTRTAGGWTNIVEGVTDQPLDPRMRAQQGRFLVGGITKRYGGMRMLLHGSDIKADRWPDITTLAINFCKQIRVPISSNWVARGWSIRVSAEWKAEIRNRMSKLHDPMTLDSMYPPLSEVKRIAMRIARGQ